jgi:hypothetical protein
MKTTLILDDALYRKAKVLAGHRGATVSSVVEEALRLMLSTEDRQTGPRAPLPAWDLGRPLVDIDDARAVRDELDKGQGIDALR